MGTHPIFESDFDCLTDMVGKSIFNHGDLVFAKVKGYPYWPARIDCVRLEKCRKKKQKNIPEDQNSYWPIFFYGTHEILWILESDLRPFEENRVQLGKASNKKKFKEAMVEAFTSPMIDFQFKTCSTEDEDKMVRWIRQESEECERTGWVDIEEAEQQKEKERKEKLKAVREKEKEETDEEDPVCSQFEQAIFRIENIEVDDTIGAMYDAPYYGRVIEKHPTFIKVQFYTRRKNNNTDYILKRKDIDDISEERQGYIFYHLDKKYVDYVLDGKVELLRLLGKYDHDQIDDFWEKWNIHVMKLRGEDTSQIQKEIEAKKQKRRSRKPVAAVASDKNESQSPAKKLRTESVLESLEHQATPPPPNEEDCEEAKKDVPPEDLGTNQDDQNGTNGQVVENAAPEEITES